MDLRHQSSAMCIIILGKDTHPWSATNVGNSILATIPVTKTGQGHFVTSHLGDKNFGDNTVAQMSRQICSHTPSALNARNSIQNMLVEKQELKHFIT